MILVPVRNANEFLAEASIGPFQLITGAGALDIIGEMNDEQLESCFRNCTWASSVGQDGNIVEDELDYLQIRIQPDMDEWFFPTISGPTFDEVIWIILSQSHETPRLLALSSARGFISEVTSSFDRANAEASNEV